MMQPTDSILATVNYLSLGVITGQIKVEVFDKVINGLIETTEGDLQGELLKLKGFTKRQICESQ